MFGIENKNYRYNDFVTLLNQEDYEWLVQTSQKLKPGSTILELGGFLMGSGAAMALANKKVSVYSVDTGWLDWLDVPGDPTAEYLRQKYSSLKLTKAKAKKIRSYQLKLAKKNLKWHTGWSRSFHPPQAPDFCFIDADHNTDAVIADFFHCYAISKPGAVIAGHDYIFPEVIKAVQKIGYVLGAPVEKATEQIWFWKKTGAEKPTFSAAQDT